MAPVSEQPTQVRPTAPPPSGRKPGLTPRDPRSLSPGGPGEPPRPPRRTGGGGGGGGGFGGSDDPRGEGDPRRTGLFVLLGASVVIALIVLTLVLNGDDNDGRVAPANQQSTRFAEDTTPTRSPETTATPKATPKPTASTPVVDDSAKATTPQEETGGVAVGGGGQTGDAADAADAEAEANAPLLQAGSVAKLTFKQGDTIRFRVTSATAQEVHVHGYDKTFNLAAGETKTIAFPAELTGIYEVEFEGTATKIAELTVEP